MTTDTEPTLADLEHTLSRYREDLAGLQSTADYYTGQADLEDTTAKRVTAALPDFDGMDRETIGNRYAARERIAQLERDRDFNLSELALLQPQIAQVRQLIAETEQAVAAHPDAAEPTAAT